MAAEVVGGAFLTVSLEVLAGRIHSIKDFVRRNKVDAGLLNKLEIKLRSVKRVLNYAEKKQLTDPAVRQWLQKLKDAIHDAEDLVDEINTEALRCEIESGQSQSSRTGALLFQVCNFISSRLNVKDVEQRINDILDTLEYIVDQKKDLGLREGVEPSSFRRSAATPLVEECDIYGRDADKQAIVDFLLSDEAGGDKISVLPIVGLGGMGKTTLVQLVYNKFDDEAMDKHFEIKAWITVSEESDVHKLTNTIYEKITKSSNSTDKETLFELQQKLKVFLKGKKFLLVLDDVWNVTYQRWCNLRSPFESAAHGSKIIVTTRIAQVASDLGTVPNRDLQILSEEDCWKLFKKHAFDNIVEPSANPDLEVIGRQIVQKCNGLPLAVKSLGSLLHSVQDLKDWENVLKNDIWNLPECDILPALWLSYYYLPSHLKRCFAYCSIFPKDYEIEKEKLVLLWMAQDLLQPHKTKIPEEVGEEYFKDLVSRSFFQYCRGNGNLITMHDLVNDLAIFVSGECCLRLEDNYSDVLIRKTRHFSSFGWNANDEKKINDLYENKVLRTLIGNRRFEVSVEHLQSMQFLRVLSLSARWLEAPLVMKLLNSIGNLKLLRYLDLYCSWVNEIPDTIGTLYNLQTLLLRGCSGFTWLPDSIGNLKHLRYLDLSESSIQKLPDTICQLHELHTLLLNFCGELTHLPTNIATLTNLRNLNLSESSIQKLPDTICQLHELHTLLLNACWELTHLPTNIATLTNLRNLNIVGTRLTEMPPKMSNLKNLLTLTDFVLGKDSGSNIKELGKLKDLHGCLRIARLENIVNVEEVYSEENLIDKKHFSELYLEWNGDIDDSREAQKVLDRLRPHSDLKVLCIRNYGGTRLSHWVGHPSFSCMKTVKLVDCKNCSILPPLGQLPSLECLEIRGFDQVRRIGDEFYSDGSSYSVITKPFQSLKRISFTRMAEWEEWVLVQVDGGIFTNVKELELWACPKLQWACLPDYLPSLETLGIPGTSPQLVASLSRCRYPSLCSLRIYESLEMKTFPGAIILPSHIQTIEIISCPELVSLPDEGWPANLKSLKIWNCWHAMQWNLGMLTSLASLEIEFIFEEEMDAFPKEEGQLPTTLTSLQLSHLPNLKSLNGSALQHLTSLQQLIISYCDQIQCLPQQGLPTTLTSLELSDLPNLKSLNGDTFRHLTSLQNLYIWRCPLLKPRCQRGIGEDWPYILHIPCIIIDYQHI